MRLGRVENASFDIFSLHDNASVSPTNACRPHYCESLCFSISKARILSLARWLLDATQILESASLAFYYVRPAEHHPQLAAADRWSTMCAARAETIVELPCGTKLAAAPLTCPWFDASAGAAGSKAPATFTHAQRILHLQLVARIPVQRIKAWKWQGPVLEDTGFDPTRMFEVTNSSLVLTADDEEDDSSSARYMYIPCYFEWPVPEPPADLERGKSAPWCRVWLPECIADRSSPPSRCRIQREVNGGMYLQAVFYLTSSPTGDAAAPTTKDKKKKAGETGGKGGTAPAAAAVADKAAAEGDKAKISMTWSVLDAMMDRMMNPDTLVTDVREIRTASGWAQCLKWAGFVAKRLMGLPPSRLKATRVPHTAGEVMSVINCSPELRTLCKTLLTQTFDDPPDPMILNKALEHAVAAATTHHFPRVANRVRFAKQLEGVTALLKKLMLSSGKSCACGKCVFESFSSYAFGLVLVSSSHPPGDLEGIPSKITFDRSACSWSARTFDDGYAALRWSCLMGNDVGVEDVRSMLDTAVDRVRKIARLAEDSKELGGGNVERGADFVATLTRVVMVCVRDALTVYSRVFPRFLSTAVSEAAVLGSGAAGAAGDSTPPPAAGAGAGSAGSSSPVVPLRPAERACVKAGQEEACSLPPAADSSAAPPAEHHGSGDWVSPVASSASGGSGTACGAGAPGGEAPCSDAGESKAAVGGDGRGRGTTAGAPGDGPFSSTSLTRESSAAAAAAAASAALPERPAELTAELRRMIAVELAQLLRRKSVLSREAALLQRNKTQYCELVERERAELARVRRDTEAVKATLTTLTAAADASDKREETLRGRHADLEAKRGEVEAVADTVAELRGRFESAGAERDRLRTEVESQKAVLQATRGVQAALQDSIRSLQGRVGEGRARLTTLRQSTAKPGTHERDMEALRHAVDAAESNAAGAVARAAAAQEEAALLRTQIQGLRALPSLAPLLDASRAEAAASLERAAATGKARAAAEASRAAGRERLQAERAVLERRRVAAREASEATRRHIAASEAELARLQEGALQLSHARDAAIASTPGPMQMPGFGGDDPLLALRPWS